MQRIYIPVVDIDLYIRRYWLIIMISGNYYDASGPYRPHCILFILLLMLLLLRFIGCATKARKDWIATRQFIIVI